MTFHDITNTRLEVSVPGTGLPNMVENPSGDLGAWFWSTPIANTALTVVAGALQFTTTVSQGCYFVSDYMPIAATQWVATRFDTTGGTAAHTVRVSYDWYDASKTLLGSTNGTTPFGVTAQTNYGAPVQAIASTAYVRARFGLYNGTGTTAPAANANYSVKRVMVTKAATSGAITNTRTNLFPNPSAEVDANSWNAGSGSTVARTTAQAYVGTASVAITSTDATQKNQTSASINTGLTAGNDYAFQVRVRSAAVTRTATLTVNWLDATFTKVGSAVLDTKTTTTGGWTLLSGVATMPLTATRLQLITDFGANPVAEVHYADAMLIEQSSTVGGYFSGASVLAGYTYAWTGTANASTSTEVAGSASFGYTEPFTWLNIFGPTHEIDVVRPALNLGILTATIFDATLDPAVTSTIKQGARVRLIVSTSPGVWTPVFTGKVFTAESTYLQAKVPGSLVKTRIELVATDNASTLAGRGESRGVATVAELPYLLEGKGAPWNVNGFGGQVATATIVSNNDNASVMDQIALTRDTVRGYAWIDRFNVAQVWDAANLASTLAATFTDVPGGLSYTDIKIGYNTKSCINSVTVTWLRVDPASGDTTEMVYGPFVNQASIDAYGVCPAEFTIHGPGESQANASAYATAVMTANATPSIRCNGLTMPVRNATELGQAAAIDLYAKVNVTYNTKVAGADARVTNIHHRIDTKSWSVDYDLDAPGIVAQPTWTPSPATNDNTDGTWIAPTLANGWINYGSGFSDAKYMRKNGIVYLKGLIKSGTVGTATPFFTLPVGYRPADQKLFAALNGGVVSGAASAGTAHTHTTANTAARVNVMPSGQVNLEGTGTNVFVSLDGISYPAEA